MAPNFIRKNKNMLPYAPKDFSHLLGLPGMSDELLNNHFTLYQGYVTNTNSLKELLAQEDLSLPAYNELKRRFGWEWNGMRLHELYFENLTKESSSASESVTAALTEGFGSYEAWEKDFLKTGALRGIGWVMLVKDRQTGALYNVWINEHDLGHLADAQPLLVMDVFEHAFMLDYGIKRADYINTFMKAIDWSIVTKRLTD